MTPDTNVNCSRYPKNCLISYNKYRSNYGYEKHPYDTIVPVGYFHIHCFNPINIYPSIRYNRIIKIYNCSPIFQNILFRTITSPNKTEDLFFCYIDHILYFVPMFSAKSSPRTVCKHPNKDAETGGAS